MQPSGIKKPCRIRQLIPSCVNIRVNVNNPRCQRTKNAAIRYRLNQDQYEKKKTQLAAV